MRKNNLLFLKILVMAFFSVSIVQAAVPQLMNYQGRLNDSSGSPVTGTKSIVFSLYSSETGTDSQVWTEQQDVTVSSGSFNAVLGSSITPIPPGVFDHSEVWLGIKVGGDAEMTPRQRITSVGYAMKAGQAGSLASSDQIVSTMPTGAAPFQVASTTLVQNLNSDSLDGKHASDFVLKAGDTVTGSLNVSQQTAAGNAADFQIENVSNANTALNVSTIGTGNAGLFMINNALNANPVVSASTSGMGKAGDFRINNDSNANPALFAFTTGSGSAVQGYTAGTGNAGLFLINNASNVNNALHAETNGSGGAVGGYANGSGTAVVGVSNGSGNAFYGLTSGSGSAFIGYTTGTGRAAHFEIGNPSNLDPALWASTNGSGNAVSGSTSGSGNAILGSTTGTGRAGDFRISNASNTNPALYASTNGSGSAVSGSTTGTGGAGDFLISNASNTSTALYASTTGIGRAGDFRISNASNTNPALYASTIGGGTAVVGSTFGTGRAGHFQIGNPSNINPALWATTNGSGDAVYGSATGSGNAIFGYTNGTGRAGYFRISNDLNTDPALYAETNGHGYAVYGKTTGDDRAGYFEIDNALNQYPAVWATTNGSGNAVYGYTSGGGSAIRGITDGSGYSGYFNGGQGVYVGGNLEVANSLEVTGVIFGSSGKLTAGGSLDVAIDLNVGGNLTKGSGSFVQPYKKDPSKEVVYAFFEGPEHAVFLRGRAKLIDGRAVIETPEYFRDVAGSDDDITVQFTPRSEESSGLAAVKVTKYEIQVKELMKGKGSYEFDYFITAKREGFEAHEPIQPNTHFSAENQTREDFERRYANTASMTTNAMRNMLIANGILTKDGKLNMEVAAKLGWTIKESDPANIEGGD